MQKHAGFPHKHDRHNKKTQDKDMKYAIIGSGAIGIYYGGLLAKAGKEVHVLLHSDYEHVKNHGLRVDSCDGSYTLPKVNAHKTTETMPVCDVVIVALKTTANNQLPQMLRPITADSTIVLLIQNGIGVEADLQTAMPNAQIAAGVAYICTLKPEPGRIDHMGLGRLSVASYSCRDTDRLAAMVNEMVSVGLRVKLAPSYDNMRWQKAVWNMTFNGMTVACNAPSAPSLLQDSETKCTIRAMMSEIIAAANACGASGVNEDYADQMMEMTAKMPPFASSMKFDYDHHKPMELHYLYEKPIEEAHRHGCQMPLIEGLAAKLAEMNKGLLTFRSGK